MLFRFSKGEFAIMRCVQCDLECANPLPSERELAQIYERGYFAGGGSGYVDYFEGEREVSAQKSRVRMDALEHHGLAPHSRILELGSANGGFLQQALSRGHTALGVEGSAEARAAASPEVMPYLRSHLSEIISEKPEHTSDQRFDAFAAFDVLEHLRSPMAELRAVRALLRPSALVAVVVPVIDNGNARYWPSTWDQYKPPEHLWYFSVESLAMTLKRSLGASILSVTSAWCRPSRLLHTGFGVKQYRALAKAEARCWLWLTHNGCISPQLLDDSVLMIAQLEP
jgi:SAM-dependent methyltransferase